MKIGTTPSFNVDVAIFLSSLQGAGIQRVMVNLADGLLKSGLRVDLVLVSAVGHLLSALPANVRIIDLGGSRTLYALPRLVRYLKIENPRSMLSSQPHMNVVAIWARILSASSCRLVISDHIDPLAAYQNSRNWKDRLLPRMTRWFYHLADQIVAVSTGTATEITRITRISAEKLRVIYNPVVTPELEKLAKEPLLDPWFANGQPPVILSVGRLTEQKDHATLLRAFSHLKKEMNARLVILGEGEEYDHLQALANDLGIQDDFKLPGFVHNPFAWMSRSRVFVLSSRWEGFANVLVEAMACGTPVVSTDCPSGPSEILDGGRFGHLVRPGDYESLSMAIRSCLEKPLTEEQLKGRARRFSIEQILPEYLELLLPV